MKNENRKWITSRVSEYFRRFIYRFSRDPFSMVGLVMVALFIVLAIFAPLIVPYPEHAGPFVDFSNASLHPSKDHLFGTDCIGRDIFSRTIFALRGALKMAIGVLMIVVPIGTIIGLVAGYYAGPVETVLMRFSDIFLAIPALVLAMAVAAILRPTLFNNMIAVCISWWPWYARLSYGMVSSYRNETFVRAAQIIGANNWYILFKEILPNCLSPIFTKMALDVGWVILIGASLSFVGLGEQPPTPALGTMVAEGSRYLPDIWWISVFPAIVIVLLILSFNFLGDGIRDALSLEEV